MEKYENLVLRGDGQTHGEANGLLEIFRVVNVRGMKLCEVFVFLCQGMAWRVQNAVTGDVMNGTVCAVMGT